MNLYRYSILRRAPAALLLAGLGALLACAPPPAPTPPPAPAPPPGPPSTYGVSFVYEPQLTLRLQRDGQPYTGEATLTIPDTERQSGEQRPLTFSDGHAPLSPEIIASFNLKQGLGLRVGDRDVVLPMAGGTNPFACAQSIYAAQLMTPCHAVPLDPSTPLDHCDTAGRRAWLNALRQVSEEAAACWSSPDAPTLERLSRLSDPPVVAFACQHLIDALGPEPGDEQGVKLLPWCLSFFREPTRTRLDHAHARQVLPDELAAAQRGSSMQMRKFYQRYRAIAPEQAESVRKLAAERFGPPDRARWFALRRVIEAQKQNNYRASLCEFRDGYVEVAIQQGSGSRYSQRPSAAERSLAGYGGDSPAMRRQQKDYTAFTQKLTAIIQATARTRNISFQYICNQGLHWYFAEVDG